MPDKLFYRERGLFMQSLHPLAALVYLGTLLLLSLVFTNPLYVLAVLTVVVLAILAADGIGAWESYVRITLLMMVMVMLINPLVVRTGHTVIWQGPLIPVVGRLNVSLEAICYGAVMSVRLLCIISIFCLYNLIVHPDKALNLFSRFTGRSVLVISLAIRMFPTMIRELENIRAVQQVRGVNFSKGPVIERMRKYTSLITVLLLSSLEASFDIAEAMQARAFGSGPRSCYSRNPWRLRDTVFLAGGLCALGVGLWGLWFNCGSFQYYPQLGSLMAAPGTVPVLLAVCLCLTIPLLIAWRWPHWTCLKSKI